MNIGQNKNNIKCGYKISENSSSHILKMRCHPYFETWALIRDVHKHRSGKQESCPHTKEQSSQVCNGGCTTEQLYPQTVNRNILKAENCVILSSFIFVFKKRHLVDLANGELNS